MVALFGKGIAVTAAHIGDFDQHHFFNIPGHRGLRHIITPFQQRFSQIFLRFNILHFNDLTN